MDDAAEKKIRDLKLRIIKAEKELAASVHNTQLGAWLRAGHPSQMAKAGERERKRLEAKLDELKAKLHELEPQSAAAPVESKKQPADEPATKTAAPAKKAAAAKAPAAKGKGKKK